MPRTGWPRIFQYRHRDRRGRARLTACPPNDGRPYKIVVHDRQAYERLCRSGAVYDAAHTGRTFRLVDNRMTS